MIPVNELLLGVGIVVLIFFVQRTFHYRKLWIQSKNKVSWIMPSNDPNDWVVEKTYSRSSDDYSVSYAVVDKDTKVHVAENFKSEEDARLYIMHSLDHFQNEQ